VTTTESGQIERLERSVEALDDKVDRLREDQARADEIRKAHSEHLEDLRRALEDHAKRTEAQFRETGERTSDGFKVLAAKIDEGRPKPWTAGELTAIGGVATTAVSAVLGGLAWLVSVVRGGEPPPIVPPPPVETPTPEAP